MRPSRQSPLLICAIVLAALSPGLAGADVLAHEVAALGTDVAAIVDVRDQELDRIHAGKPVLRLALTAERGVAQETTVMTLWRSPVVPVRVRIEARGLTAFASEGDATGLAFSGDAVNGSVQGTVTMAMERGPAWEQPVQEHLGDHPAVTIAFAVKAQWQEGRVAGTCTAVAQPLPPLIGAKPAPRLPDWTYALSGSVRQVERLAGQAAPGRGAETLPAELYQHACRLELEADRAYARLRSLVLLRRKQVTWNDASATGFTPQVLRPAISFEAQARRSDGPAGLDDGIEVKDDAGAMAAAKKALGAVTINVAAIRARVARMKALALALRPEGPEPIKAAACDDPDFGPWFGERFLSGGKGVLQLPPDAGTEGSPQWAAITDWRLLGPFPLTAFTHSLPDLPDQVLMGDETIRVRTEHWQRLHDKAGYSGSATSTWQAVIPPPGAGGFGHLGFPKWFGFNPAYFGLSQSLGGVWGGQPYSTIYLRCVVKSDADRTLWAGIGVTQRGRLWLGDQLLWESPAQLEVIRRQETGLVRIPFRSGLNVLTLRLDVEFASPSCWLRLCLRGGPRPATVVAERAKAIAELTKGGISGTVGYRGNGSGFYPNSDPPVAFAIKARQNVLWQTPTTYFGNATPVPVPGSDRLLITVDPFWLVCLAKSDGRELWRRPVSLFDLLPDDERKKGWALYEAWWQARLARDVLPVHLGVGKMKYPWPRWLKDSWYWAEGTGIWAKAPGKAADERDGAAPELVALLDQRDELEKSPDQVAVKDALEAVYAKIGKLQSARFSKDPDSPIAKDSAVEKAEGAMVGLVAKHSHANSMGGGYWIDYTGWMFPTPVTDGKHIWVKNGSDVAACFDLDGKEIWKVQTWISSSADHSLSSPCLAGGLLLLYGGNLEHEPGKRGKDGGKVLALDAATGAKRWETRDLPDAGWHVASPVVTVLSDGKTAMPVVVTGGGSVLRLEDGKVLIRDCGVNSGVPSPTVIGNQLVMGLTPVQFLMESRDLIGARLSWSVRFGADYGGSTAYDGIVQHTMGVNDSPEQGFGERGNAIGVKIEGGKGEGWKALQTFDLATGNHLGSIPLLRKSGGQWSPTSVGDRHAYHLLGEQIFQSIGPKAPMDLVVLTRERQPLRLASNAIDRTYGAAALEGDRIYLRGYLGVTCIGYTGDTGRAYEARTVARNLLDDVYGQKPTDTPEREIPPSGPVSGNRHNAFSSSTITAGIPPHTWRILGPFDASAAEAALSAVKPDSGLLREQSVGVGSATLKVVALNQESLLIADFPRWRLDPANLTDIHRLRRAVDLGFVLRNANKTACLVAADLRSTRNHVVRFDQDLLKARAWLGGVEIRHGDRVRLTEGSYQLLLLVSVDAVPSDALWLSPRFWPSDQVEEETRRWTAYGKRIAPYLRNVMKLAPRSAESAQAHTFLEGLGREAGP